MQIWKGESKHTANSPPPPPHQKTKKQTHTHREERGQQSGQTWVSFAAFHCIFRIELNSLKLIVLRKTLQELKYCLLEFEEEGGSIFSRRHWIMGEKRGVDSKGPLPERV